MPKKPKTPQPETPDAPQERDNFSTPSYGTDILIPFIPKSVKRIWEGCVGEGRMANRFRHHGFEVFGTDLSTGHNVLQYECPEYDMFGTNPPFSAKKSVWDTIVERDRIAAILIPCDYSSWVIKAIREQGAERIIPARRIDYITPNIVARVHQCEVIALYNRTFRKKIKKYEKVPARFRVAHAALHVYRNVDSIPQELIARWSTSQFHSCWMCYKFGIGRSETFVDLTREMKLNIL